MAPDGAAARAGLDQASAGRWSGSGHDEQAVWGECLGSGKVPYLTQVALADGATKCSCPSRKFPCKHALGLLVRYAEGAVPAARPPEWVSQWLAGRATRSAWQDRQDGLVDEQAAQRRSAERDAKVDAGVDEMRRWLADLARVGVGAAQSQPWGWWDAQARRMIDAQARGLAGQIRRMASIAATGGLRADWPDRLTDQLGSAASAEEVSASGDRITDAWAVLGQRLGEEQNLRSLQQWLYGERTGEVV